MAKNSKKTPAKVKKHSSKYSKLAILAAKELAAKKSALVKAEKALAKAQKTHSDLLSEVARLDMLDRSLKALINGTEPPQNIRYVYSYPQWVWQPGWTWNGYTYCNSLGSTGTVTTPSIYNTQTSGYQTSNLNLTTGTNAVLTSNITSPTWTTANCANVSLAGAGDSLTYTGDTLGWQTSSIGATQPSAFTVNTNIGTADLTIDLSTGAVQEDKDTDITTEEVLKAAAVAGDGEED